MSEHSNSVTSIFFALGANVAICVAKLGAALFTGSGAMLAEGIHSLADSGNQILLLVGIRQAKRPPTPDYPLGFGKSIYFWSFIVALMMFSMGGVFSVYEGIHKIAHPEPLKNPWIAVGVLLIAVALLVGIEVKNLLIGQGVDPEVHAEMTAFLASQPEIRRVFNLLTYQLGSDVMVAVKAEMAESESPQELIRAINRCERRLKERFPQVVWSFFEPDDAD